MPGNNKGPEKLSNFFDAGELEKIKVSSPDKYNTIAEKVHLFAKTQKDIAALKSELSGTVDERLDILIGYIDKSEKTASLGPIKGVKAKAEGKIAEVKDDVVDAVKDKVGFGKITAIFDTISAQFSGMIDKIIVALSSKFGGILSIFGIGGVAAATLPEGNKKGTDDKKIILPKADESVEYNKSKEEDPGKRSEIYYDFGKKGMKHFLNDRFTSADNFGTLSDALNGYTVHEMKVLKFDSIPVGKRSGFDENQFEKFQTNVLGVDMRILYGNLLTGDNILLLDSNPEVKKVLVYNNIVSSEDFNVDILTIEQLYILFSLVSVHIIGAGVSTIPGVGKGVIDKLFSVSSDMGGVSGIKEEMKAAQIHFEKTIISQKTGKEIIDNIDNFSENSSFYVNNIEGVTDKEQLKNVLDFKDFIESDILENKKYNLGQQNLIKKSISFQDVLNLYIFLRGDKNIDTFESSYIYVYIGNMLENNSGAYLKNLTELTLSEKEDIITKEEQELIKVLAKKILDKTWLDALRENAQKIMDAGLEHIDDSPETLAYIAGLVAILKWTPAGRGIKVLYGLVGKKGIAFLASAGIFTYFYKQIPVGLQQEFQENKKYLKENGLDLDALL